MDVPGDVRPDGSLRDGHHRDGSVGGQPIRFVVAAGVVADIVDVTEQEGHGTETLHARAGETWNERDGISSCWNTR